MIETILSSGTVLLALASPLLLMVLMWRRMKRVNAELAERNRQKHTARPRQEDADGRGYDVNEDLIEQGAAARESRWPLS